MDFGNIFWKVARILISRVEVKDEAEERLKTGEEGSRILISRVEVKDEAEERLKTGEEGENDLEEEGPGHGMLGVLGTEEIQVKIE